MKLLIQWWVDKKTMTETFLKKWWNEKLDVKDIAARTHKLVAKTIKLNDLKGNQATLNHLAFQTLGSNLNREDFVLADLQINAFKAKAWKGDKLMDPTNFKTLAEGVQKGEVEAATVFSPIRVVSFLFGYISVILWLMVCLGLGSFSVYAQQGGERQDEPRNKESLFRAQEH